MARISDDAVILSTQTEDDSRLSPIDSDAIATVRNTIFTAEADRDFLTFEANVATMTK